MLGDIGRTGEAEQVVARAKECFDRAGVISAELAFLLALTFSWQGPRPIEEEIVRGEHVLSSADETSPIAAYTLLGLAVISPWSVGSTRHGRSAGEAHRPSGSSAWPSSWRPPRGCPRRSWNWWHRIRSRGSGDPSRLRHLERMGGGASLESGGCPRRGPLRAGTVRGVLEHRRGGRGHLRVRRHGPQIWSRSVRRRLLRVSSASTKPSATPAWPSPSRRTPTGPAIKVRPGSPSPRS